MSKIFVAIITFIKSKQKLRCGIPENGCKIEGLKNVNQIFFKANKLNNTSQK